MPGGSVDEISILGRELKMKKSAKFQRIMTENNLRPAQLLKIGDMVSDVLYATWRAPIGWSGLIVSASWAFGPLAGCFSAQAGGIPTHCAA